MIKCTFGFLFLISALLVLAVSAPATTVKPLSISKAVGQVANQVVTSREVQISYAIEQLLLTHGADKNSAPDRSLWLVQAGDEVFRTHLSQVLMELLIKLEAESFSVAQVSPEEIKAEVKLVTEGMKGWSEWKKWEVNETEVEQLLMRRRVAKNFLKFKTESSGVVISDEECKRYYEKNRVKFGSAPFAQFKDSIREVLAQKQLEEKLKDWFEILKRKYRLRFLKPVD